MKLDKKFFNHRSLCGIIMIIAALISIVYKVSNDLEIPRVGIIVIFISAIYIIGLGYYKIET